MMISWRVPGRIAMLCIVSLVVVAFIALISSTPLPDWRQLISDSYLQHVLRFSILQATLSTLLAVLPAIPIAKALFRRRFIGRQLLLKCCAMTLILPALIAIFGLLSIYGREGWLAQLCQLLHLNYHFSPYGLPGILLAHLFLNLPLATRFFIQALTQIPGEQRQLAAQLNIQGWALFRYVEWPWLKRQLLPVSALIFMLCFASFTVVLTLGGGPQATTLELAIYQALSYEFDPARAALLALLQLILCLGLMVLMQSLTPVLSTPPSLLGQWRDPWDRWQSKLLDSVWILLLLLLLLPPLVAVVINGLTPETLRDLTSPILWRAVVTSFVTAICAAGLCLTLSIMLLWSSREYRRRQHNVQAQLLESCAMLPLAMPGIVLATGIFLLCNATIGIPNSPILILISCNALLALPYAIKVLDYPMRDITNSYSHLCLSLNITGWNRFRLIEWRALRPAIKQALCFSAVLSVGDFGVIALFGSDQFKTLPFYLYQQIGAYRSQQAAVSALLLLVICFLLFILLEKVTGRDIKTR